MKKSMLFILIAAMGMLALPRCSKETDRQIKLAPRPVGALMQDQVKTIQIAIEEKKKVAVLKFENKSNLQEANWMAIGLMRMLNSSLVQSRQLVVTPGNTIRDAQIELGIRISLFGGRDESLQSSCKIAIRMGGDPFPDVNRKHWPLRQYGL